MSADKILHEVRVGKHQHVRGLLQTGKYVYSNKDFGAVEEYLRHEAKPVRNHARVLTVSQTTDRFMQVRQVSCCKLSRTMAFCFNAAQAKRALRLVWGESRCVIFSCLFWFHAAWRRCLVPPPHILLLILYLCTFVATIIYLPRSSHPLLLLQL